MKEYEKLACDWYETVLLEERNIGFITAYEEGFIEARKRILRYLEVACDRKFIITSVEQFGEREV